MFALLHNIRSLHNVGSIFRTADAVGIEKLYLCGYTPAPQDEFGRIRQQLVKVSLGAEKSVPWEKAVSTTRLMGKLKKQGYKVFVVEQDKKSVPYTTVNVSKSSLQETALVFGNEIRGLPQGILSRADKILEIPMKGKKESLNVSVAFGVVAFHFIVSSARIPRHLRRG